MTIVENLRQNVTALARENTQLRREVERAQKSAQAAEAARDRLATRVLAVERRVASIDELRLQREGLLAEVGRLTERLARLHASAHRCVYCGDPIAKGHVACPAHRELLDLDRAFAPRRGATTRSTTTAGPRTS